MRFFAENGFAGTIRELADFMGVSSALIFRYYATKDELIRAVYETLYVQRINGEWISLLADRSRSIEQRLKAFYRSYAKVSDDFRWVRVAIGVSLSNFSLIREYLDRFVSTLLEKMAHEIEFARTGSELDQVGRDEIERMWQLHSSLMYFLIRKHVHHAQVEADTMAMMDRAIEHFLRGFDPPLLDAPRAGA